MPPITIRPAQTADADALGRVHVQVWREAYTGLIPQSYLDRLSAEERAERWAGVLTEARPRTATFTAWQDGELLGFSGCGPARDPKLGADGELYMINLVRAGHGLGLGRMLVTHIAQALHESGFEQMGLWVFLANTHARGFYKHLGGSESAQTHDVTFDDVTLPECAVLWKNLPVLMSPS